MLAIEVKDLKKTYRAAQRGSGTAGAIKALFKPTYTEVEAVKGVSFEIEQGSIIGFLGPNGAGKTTTLKMLSGILYPTSGTAKVLGFTPFDRKSEMLRQISLVMGNKNQLWWDLPATDSFRVLKELYEVSDADYKRRTEFLIETLDLQDKVQTQVRKMSLGERMKCELVAALLHAPRVVFLDEPTIGLDVVSQKRIRDFLRQLHTEEGCTIILTSHYMQDVEELCERVIIIDQGAKVFEGTLDQLTKSFGAHKKLRLSFSKQIEQPDLAPYGKLVSSEDLSAVLEVPAEEIAAKTALALNNLPIVDLAVESVDIEEVIRDLFERK